MSDQAEPKFSLRIMDPRALAPGEINLLVFGPDPQLIEAAAADLEWIIRRVTAIDPNFVVLVGLSTRPGQPRSRADWERALDQLGAAIRGGSPLQ